MIVVAGRLFARSSDAGRRWPYGPAWDATLELDQFCELRDAAAPGTTHSGPRLALANLFAQIPVAVLRARYITSRAQRARGRVAALAT
jgi:hypothetical protein